MKKLLTIVAVLLVTLAFTIGASAATAADAPENIKIDQAQKKQPAVDFPHKAHWELTECTTCHHTLEAEDETVKACHECHGSKDGEAPRVKTAFHSTCIGCHEYTIAHGEEAGPLKKKCKLCHVK